MRRLVVLKVGGSGFYSSACGEAGGAYGLTTDCRWLNRSYRRRCKKLDEDDCGFELVERNGPECRLFGPGLSVRHRSIIPHEACSRGGDVARDGWLEAMTDPNAD